MEGKLYSRDRRCLVKIREIKNCKKDIFKQKIGGDNKQFFQRTKWCDVKKMCLFSKEKTDSEKSDSIKRVAKAT